MAMLHLLVLFLLTFGEKVAESDDSQIAALDDNIEPQSSCNIPIEVIHNNIIIVIKPCKVFKVLRCFCLVADRSQQFNDSTVIPHVRIGKCIYSCFHTEKHDEYYHVNVSSSHKGTCHRVNHEGTLCGQCRPGYGVPVYSFNLTCVPCRNVSLWNTIPKYILVAYGPLTLFLIAIVIFTVSVNSAPLHGWILVCQLITSNIVMYIITFKNTFHSNSSWPYVQSMASIYGLWNLDFFRSVYEPFCLHQSLTTLEVISLDYIIAAYPLVLIIAMYAMVCMYSRNVRPVVVIGHWLHCCFYRFRRQLDIKTSLIDAFGTFFSLSFVKFLSTTVNLLISSSVWENDEAGTTQWHIYLQGEERPFRGTHIPYAIISLMVTIVCNIIPLALLLLYSLPKGQIILDIIPKSVQRAIYPFVDNILGCYKDGTKGDRNCHYFAVVYYLIFTGTLISLIVTRNILVFGWSVYVCTLAGMLVAVIQPYKSKIYNTVDTILTLSVALCFSGSFSSIVSLIEGLYEKILSYLMFITPIFVPLIYITGYLGRKVYLKLSSVYHSNYKKQESDEQPLLFAQSACLSLS